MRTARWFGAICALLLAAASCQAEIAAQTVAVGTMQVKGINLVEIDASHVRVAVNLNLVPARTATLKDLHLCALRLNGLPVYAAPLDQEIALRKDVSTALPPLYVTVLFRDVTTVEPLRRMIEKQSVRVQGELIAGVRLSFVEKLALHTQHPEVAFALSQEVPAEIGGAPFERNLALTLLSAIDSGLGAKDTADKVIPGLRPAWIGELETSAQGNIYAVESSYAVQQGGESYPVLSAALGFRLNSGKIVTTAEALAPWRYDAEFLGAVKSGVAKIDKKSQEMALRPVGGDGAMLKLSAQDFALETRGNPEEDSITAVSPTYGKVQVFERASASTLAVLSPRTPLLQPGLRAASAEVAARESWEQVAVFRLRTDPASGTSMPVEVLALAARREGKAIRLSEPVDSAVFGSPILTPDGVIGLVQDEQAGAFLPGDLLTSAPAKDVR